MSSPPASPPSSQIPSPPSPQPCPTQSPADGVPRIATQKLKICNDHRCDDSSAESNTSGSQDDQDASDASLEPAHSTDDSSIVVMCGTEGFWVGQVTSLQELNNLVSRGGRVLPSDQETIQALVSLRRVMKTHWAGPYAAAIGNFDPRLELDTIVTSNSGHHASNSDSGEESVSSDDDDSSFAESSNFDDTNALGEDSDEENSDEDSDAEDIDDDSDCRVIISSAKRAAAEPVALRKKRITSDEDD